jgi:hypothetical protein
MNRLLLSLVLACCAATARDGSTSDVSAAQPGARSEQTSSGDALAVAFLDWDAPVMAALAASPNPRDRALAASRFDGHVDAVLGRFRHTGTGLRDQNGGAFRAHRDWATIAQSRARRPATESPAGPEAWAWESRCAVIRRAGITGFAASRAWCTLAPPGIPAEASCERS